jgi:hypothetical protein
MSDIIFNGVVTSPPEQHLPSDHAGLFAETFGKVNVSDFEQIRCR